VVGAALEPLARERGREVAGRQAGAAPAAVLRRWPDDVLAEPKPSEEKEPS
jgi:thioredoxin 2